MKIISEDIKKIIDSKLNWNLFNDKTVLITGANGMIGNYLVKTFEYLAKERDIKVNLILLVRESINKKPENCIKVLTQDVTLPIKLNEKVDYIIHAASPASPIIMKERPVDTFNANVLGALNCLELAKENGAEFIFISSREVYGAPIKKTMFSEEDLGLIDHFSPRASYSEGKKASETLIAAYISQYKIKAKTLRLAHTYGPGININDGRVQCDFMKDYLNNTSIKLNSDGSSIRTYTYISDAISGMFFAIIKGTEEIYNISNDKEKTTLLELAKTIASINNKNLKIEFTNKDKNVSYSPVKFGTLDSKKLRKLGWKPKTGILEGFTRTINHLEEIKR